MNKTCSKCGHEANEGEMFTTFVNPNSEWWLTLFENPQYCSVCLPSKFEPHGCQCKPDEGSKDE